jgi:hypothetical protein
MARLNSKGGNGDRGKNDQVPIDNSFDLLGEPLRRYIIDYCASATERVFEFDALVDYLDRKQPAHGKDREDIAIELHHQHLPKLADADVIEFDPRSGTLRYLGDDRLEEWIHRIDSEPLE